MRLLKSKIKKEHVIEDYKKHLRYEKPSDRKRKALIDARKRARKMQRLRDL
jgi:ribosomal protein S21